MRHDLADTGNVASDTLASAAPVVDTIEPVLTSTAAAPSHPTSDASDPADTGNVASDTPASAAPVVDTIEPVLTSTAAAPSHPTSDASDPADTGNVASDALASAAPVVDAIEPVLTSTAAAPSHPTSDASDPADTGNVASDALASVAPVVDTAETGAHHNSCRAERSDHRRVTFDSAGYQQRSSQASEPADTLLALATATDAPIEVPESATAAPADVATDVSNDAAAVDPAPVAGDVIALNDAPPPPANALFTGNQYTDYGVTLSSDIVVPPQDAASPTDAASAHDTSVPAVADSRSTRHRLPTSWIRIIQSITLDNAIL